MRRKKSCLFIVFFLLSISFSSFAESNIKRFEIFLTGKWEWIAINDDSYFDSSYRYNFEYIRCFSFSKDESRILWYGNRHYSNGIVGGESDYIANIYLTEDGTGCIYITIIVPKQGDVCVGKISFSADGKTLLILPTTGGTALYQKTDK